MDVCSLLGIIVVGWMYWTMCSRLYKEKHEK